MQLSLLIRRYFPHLLVGLSISLVMAGAYAAVSFAASSAPKAVWPLNPVTITFPGIAGSGNVGEFVKCAPKTTNVNFKTSVSNPSKLSLAVNPTGVAMCGPAPEAVTVTAHCIVMAVSCKGTYAGIVTILQGYATIPPSLGITIVVT